jgi:D-alanyl-lipoteichoic acid acyltransferase DltB (MBOAT superfamily)
MLFNSFQFALFFVVVYGLYLILPHRWQNRLLLVTSYFFYGSWDWRFLSLILLSTGINFAAGLAIGAADTRQRRRTVLTACVVANLAILGVFKYFNFFVENLQALLSLGGMQPDARFFNIILPVGISFYTFQGMSYALDVMSTARSWRQPGVSGTLRCTLLSFRSLWPDQSSAPSTSFRRYCRLAR